jgi:hypothetical protein
MKPWGRRWMDRGLRPVQIAAELCSGSDPIHEVDGVQTGSDLVPESHGEGEPVVIASQTDEVAQWPSEIALCQDESGSPAHSDYRCRCGRIILVPTTPCQPTAGPPDARALSARRSGCYSS